MLAEFTTQTGAEAVPGSAIRAARRALLDFCGVTLAGSRHPSMRALRGVFESQTRGTSLIIGTSERTSAAAAAQINGFAAHVNDWDDTILPARAHFSATLFPAILAESANHDWSLWDALVAFSIGFETSARLSAASYPAIHHNKWHTTSVIGPVGVAAAVGRLLGASAEQITNAIGFATNGSCGLMSAFGTPVKALNVGHAAAWGLTSAKLGFGFGTHQDSVDTGGFMQCFANDDSLRECMNGLGEAWAIERNGFKPYPCGFVAHPTIDALRDLSAFAEGRLPIGIKVEVAPIVLELMGRHQPTNGLEAKFSLSHVAAYAWVFGNVSTDAFGDASISDQRVCDTVRKILVVPTPSMPQEAARAEVTYQDGSHQDVTIHAARGSEGRVMSDDDLIEKFLSASSGCNRCVQQKLVDWILSASMESPLSTLVEMLQGRL